MKIKDLIKDSVFCCIGYADNKDFSNLEKFIVHNKFLLDLFSDITVIYNGNPSNCGKIFKLWWKYFDNKNGKYIHLIYQPENRGHTFGTMDLDNQCIELSKSIAHKKYIFKSTDDIIFFPQFLEKEIPEVDFYYLNGIGYAGIERYSFNYDRIMKEDFFPQTNFYIINKDIDYLNPEEEVNEIFELQKQYPNKKPWELKQGFESETMLKKCVERNKYSKHHLISPYRYEYLLQIISYYNIHDSSHKNIELMDPGICHLHYPNELVISI